MRWYIFVAVLVFNSGHLAVASARSCNDTLTGQPQPKRVLVIGGTQYFGKRLVQLLVDSGVDVTIASRGRIPDPFGNQVRRIVVDRNDTRAFRRAMSRKDWDVVFDQVCFTPAAARAATEAFSGRVGRYILTSTGSVYQTGGLLPESSFDPYSYPVKPSGEEPLSYGEGKRLAEAVFFQKADFQVVAMRIPFVFGPDDYSGRLEFHIDHVLKGEPLVVGDMNAGLSFIQSAEAARFLQWIAAQSFTGPINASSNGHPSLRTIIGVIEKSTGKVALIRTSGDEIDFSPLYTTEASKMDTSKAKALGFKFSSANRWLPALLRSLIASRNSM